MRLCGLRSHEAGDQSVLLCAQVSALFCAATLLAAGSWLASGRVRRPIRHIAPLDSPGRACSSDAANLTG